ncbi:MAG TPA: DUF4340 domain-containing protein [Caulifigura sp.]|nr:DUF4340 domain-containing protein [Caulifigura sp.]
MNPANRTLAFLLVAACSVGVAVGAHMMYQPSAASTKTDVGSKFYEEFDPTKATYLGVAAFNSATNKVDEFIVEKRDGQWRIPSHHNYPADARDRLAKTAASMIGVTRGQLDNLSADSHQRLNLLDPLDKKVVGADGRGNRITIKDGDTVLTDLIIGKKEEGAGDRYYVRRPDEDRVYLAQVRPELSTKFTDWIQPNVLDASAATFRQMVLDRYSVDETKGQLVSGERSELNRNSASDEWKLEGIPAGQKLKTSVVNQMTSSLGDMKIVGVRPKTPGIAALIKGDAKARRTAVDMIDMQDKGFFSDPKGGIVSNEGDFLAGTSEGITYVLRFGKLVSGEDVDIEIGDSKKLSEEEAEKALEARKSKGEDGAKDEKPADDKAKEGDKAEEGEKKKENRFLFVTAQLNEKLLGEPPVEPVKPTPPPGYTPKEKPAKNAPTIPGFNETGKDQPAPPAEPKKETSAVVGGVRTFAGPGADPVQDEKKPDAPAEEKTAETKPDAEPTGEKPAATTEPPATEKPAEAKPVESKPADDKPAVNPAEPPKAEAPKDPFAEYEAALAKYEQEMDEYRVRKGEYDERLKRAREREKSLNARFADWYYVIPADVFNSLNVKPADLIEPESAAKPEGGPVGLPPGLEGLQLPGATEPPAPPAAGKTDPPAPPATTPATASEPAKEEPKVDAPKADAEPASKEPAEAKVDTPAPKPE